MTDEDHRLACPPCLRRMARPLTLKPSSFRRFQQAFAGVVALACLATLFFVVLRWRVSTPALHLNLDRFGYDQLSGKP